tara:strand:+ start:98 stop:730 length:633 start_codon:yes stop_codon:yes gene_type:complete
MENEKIIIVDYGVGNVLSLSRAIKKCNKIAILTDNLKEIQSATHIFLPGVGAFKSAVRLLKEKKIFEVIQNLDFTKKRLMGICLGMQLLFESSEEESITEGLNLISGKVKKIEMQKDKIKFFKIPNIGWHKLINNTDENNLFDLKNNTYVYFVHSYMAHMKNHNDCLSYVDYGGIKIPAIVKEKNIYGCQFHPEKSGEQGINIIKSFLSI